MAYKKKLIEVALPLKAINEASAREKSIRHGHPSTLHLWWARRPLAAACAVIFAQMVDDPSGHPDKFPDEEAQEQERQRLFRLIEELVKWENTTNEKVLNQAKEEIWKSWRATCEENKNHPQAAELFNPDKLPAFHDPFAGGGSLPLEAQRLGLESYASDLNPVAVLINKAMIEIPPKFAGKQPVNPESRKQKGITKGSWKGAQGLAEDVHYYGKWMRDEAEKRIGYLYPKIEITEEMAQERSDLKLYVGHKLTVIAWLWARTVKSPNPAFANVDVPLASTFMLSTKVGKEVYVEPLIEGEDYHFTVKMGKPKDMESVKCGTKMARANFRCLISGQPIPGNYIKNEGQNGRMGSRLMAIVAEGDRGRVYLSPTAEMTAVAKEAVPSWYPSGDVPAKLTGGTCVPYGMKEWRDLFTPRQLVALTTFSDLVQEAREKVKYDALAAGMPDNSISLNTGGSGAQAYADAVSTYLSFLIDQESNQSSTICGWNNINQQMIVTFSRQAIPMVWDYAECNVFSNSTGSFANLLERQVKGIRDLTDGLTNGNALQKDATIQSLSYRKIVSTDPPYYDNIAYADISDFFYVWLRRSLKSTFPDIFATLVTPKDEELVATSYRHGSKEAAEKFFLNGMTKAMNCLAEQAHPNFPVTIYYAFKQSETEKEGTASTGWEIFLDAVIQSGFALTGTWPMKTESANKLKAKVNALASSIILVCRRRDENALTATRREFLNALKSELPISLKHLQRENIAPVDLQQAAIGPGMAIYTRYSRVLDAQGNALSVHEALSLINQILAEVLAEQEGDFDADSRWALVWFDENGFDEGSFGKAEQLSKTKNTSVSGMVEAGILTSKGGKVRLLKPEELPKDWDPVRDSRLTVWEMVHHLIRLLDIGGEDAAAEMVVKLGGKADTARELAYLLYTLCERKKRSQEAFAYNALVQSWPEILRLSREEKILPKGQTHLVEEE